MEPNLPTYDTGDHGRNTLLPLQQLRPLNVATNEPTTTANDIVKWVWQITEHMREYMLKYKTSPILSNVGNIYVNHNNDIVSTSVVDPMSMYSNINEDSFVDSIMRVHAVVTESISPSTKLVNNSNNIALISVIGTYYYAAASSKATTFTTSNVCELLLSYKTW